MVNHEAAGIRPVDVGPGDGRRLGQTGAGDRPCAADGFMANATHSLHPSLGPTPGRVRPERHFAASMHCEPVLEGRRPASLPFRYRTHGVVVKAKLTKRNVL